jgi:hypothetical protein
MVDRARLRKSGILCLHCLRNFAYYRVAEEQNPTQTPQQFWITIHNNFLDIGVLEWCKLFADLKGKHHWKKVVIDQDEFVESLLMKLRITDAMFLAYVDEMRTYRDKFVAHLDEQNVMNIPNLVPAIKATQHLYSQMLKENELDVFSDAPRSSITFYRERLAHSRWAYAQHQNSAV